MPFHFDGEQRDSNQLYRFSDNQVVFPLTFIPTAEKRLIATVMCREFPDTDLKRIADGDAIAYKKLFVFFYQQLVQFSTGIVGSKETAEEVVCDVMTNIWQHRQRLSGIDNIRLYLYTSTKNRSLNRLKQEQRLAWNSFDDADIEISSLHNNPEELMLTSEMLKRVQSAVLHLPPKCQMIFKLIKDDGLTYRETAALLNISVKTVENQMTIAIRKIAHSISFQQSRAVAL